MIARLREVMAVPGNDNGVAMVNQTMHRIDLYNQADAINTCMVAPQSLTISRKLNKITDLH
jgi:hypothetical protein|tara:strand:+ start:2814 stop:2996 length:183 start_codon:yes stop_codon:yes gene_type:complete